MFSSTVMTASLIVFLLLIVVSAFAERGRLFWRKQAVYLYLILTAAFVARSAYFTYAQFALWKNTIPGKYLLPPYQPASYFIQYAFFHFWSHFLAALVFSLIILLLARYFNQRHGGRYFWPEEPWYIAIAILAVGYPGWLIYFPLILVTPFLFSIFYFLFYRKMERISYYHLWLPLAIATIVLNQWLSTFPFWSKLII